VEAGEDRRGGTFILHGRGEKVLKKIYTLPKYYGRLTCNVYCPLNECSGA